MLECYLPGRCGVVVTGHDLHAGIKRALSFNGIMG
jgi:hypothetical protein